MQTLTTYVSNKKNEIQVDNKTLKEICLQQEAMEKEMKVSQRVQASTFKEQNLADVGTNVDIEPKTILIAKEMSPTDKEKLKKLLK